MRRRSPMPLGPCDLGEVSRVHGAQQDFAAHGVGELVGGGLPLRHRIHQ